MTVITAIFALFMVPSGATEPACEELLRNSILELESARQTNQSLFIQGKISQEQFSRRQSELNNKETNIKQSNPGVNLLAKQYEDSKEEVPEPEVDLDTTPEQLAVKNIFNIIPEDKDILKMDLNPKDLSSLLILTERKYVNSIYDSEIYIAQQSEIPDEHIDLDKELNEPDGVVIKEALFWPENKSDILIRTQLGAYHYSLSKNELVRKSGGYNRNYVLSRTENFQYPSVSGDTNKIMVLGRGKHLSQSFQASRKMDYPALANVTMSPQEDYVLFQEKDRIAFYEKSSEESYWFHSGAENFVAAMISWDSRLIYYMYENGEISSANIESLKQDRRDEIFQSIVRNASAVVRAAKFSPNGRFVAAAYGDYSTDASGSSKLRFMVYDLHNDQLIYDEALDPQFGPGLNVQFTRNSQYAYVHCNKIASVFKIVPGQVEAIQ